MICGLIFGRQENLSRALAALQRRFGPLDHQSPVLAFTHTAYYEEEFGPGLRRLLVSFRRPVKPQDLSAIKRFCNRLERRLSVKGRRTVNIDPGYLDLARLVLATTKDHAHRIYLRDGIYAEVTLSYTRNSFGPCPWTYPDYRTAEYIGFFNHCRCLYRAQSKA